MSQATDDLVDRFAAAMKDKLRRAEEKYGWDDGFLEPENIDGMREELYFHLTKGDPRDVANYCAFLWHHDASTKRGGEQIPRSTAYASTWEDTDQ